jgi:tetratricopeptide (TPR) repeat protein
MSSISGRRIVSRESRKGTSRLARRPVSWLFLAVVSSIACLGLLALSNWMTTNSYVRLFSIAEAAARERDWTTAQHYWRVINDTPAATSASHLGEARACIALGQAGQSELSLRRAINANPSELESWRLLLQILQVENRTLDAQRIGWQAYDEVLPTARRELLRHLTLAILTDLPPDEKIRTTVRRWVEADVNDVDAEIALWQQIAAQPRAGDPDRPSSLIRLEELVAKHPDHIRAREALVTSLADAGEPVRGRAVLDAWPRSDRDARYWRLRGRWELEYEHHPQQAADALQTALKELPQDWRSWSRLSRALRMLEHHDESLQAAEMVRRIRELSDPLVLGSRLRAAFDHLNDPKALTDLAALSKQAGLTRLSDAWLAEVQYASATASAPHL